MGPEVDMQPGWGGRGSEGRRGRVIPDEVERPTSSVFGPQGEVVEEKSVD